MKVFVSFIVAFFIVISTSAQVKTPELFGVDYSIDKLKNDSINGSLYNINAFTNFPIYKNDKNVFGGRIQYKTRNINELNNEINRDFHSFDINTFWGIKLNEKAELLAFAQLGLYSELKDWNADDLRYSFGFRYNITHGSKLKTGWGLAYNKQFFGNQISPFIFVDYDFNYRWKISGLFPIKPKLSYKINEKMNWVTELSGSANSFRISDTENNFVRINNWNVVSKIEYTLRKHHQFFAGFGHNLRQDIKLYNQGSGNDWTIFTFDITGKEKPIYQARTSGYKLEIGYRFILNMSGQ
ncbi:MAG: DUF6268 family outer membrane beta-barrel protein [Pseudosphingobacterium sp.]|nr:DUF6268 family outer membrane beta-barrel protein [Pseudosphingobacterium sp.]